MWLRTGLVLVACFGLSACGSDTPWTTQVCDSCNWDAAKIQLVDAIPNDTFSLVGPIAVEYFNIAEGNFPDSATAERFANEHQWRYRITDQYGYYHAVVRPMLERYGVQVTDTIKWRTILFFTDHSDYIVDAAPYRSQDGVIFFRPGKAPIFWTADVYRNNCTDTTFVKCYFGD
jgi:hypothetical protein